MTETVQIQLITAIGTVIVTALTVGLPLWLKADNAEKKAEKAVTDNEKAIKTQHDLMNSRLDEFKRNAIAAAVAEGKLLGAAELQATIDGKAAAVAESKTEVQSVKIVDTEKPVPIVDVGSKEKP